MKKALLLVEAPKRRLVGQFLELPCHPVRLDMQPAEYFVFMRYRRSSFLNSRQPCVLAT